MPPGPDARSARRTARLSPGAGAIGFRPDGSRPHGAGHGGVAIASEPEAALVRPLVDHLVATTDLPVSEAARVVADVVAFFSESTEQFVRRRHRELQAAGRRNEEIFAEVAAELLTWRVVPPHLTLRQLRRIVYG
jgi:polyhydroxyalkanoate synthesis regulator phasin